MKRHVSVLPGLLLLLGSLICPGVFAQFTYHTETAYDALGRLSRLTYPNGAYVSYAYDHDAGPATEVVYHHGQNAYPFVTDLSLHVSGRPLTVTIDGGEKTYGYDGLNQLTDARFQFGGTTRYDAHGFSYDHQGDLSAYTRNDPGLSATLGFGYTEQGLLREFRLGSHTARYRHDRHGNLTGVDGFQADPYHIPDVDTGEGYDDKMHRVGWIYDQAGRLLRDDTYVYSYDAGGLLAMVREVAGGIPVETYLYDDAGNRVRTAHVKTGDTTYFVRNAGGEVLAEYLDRPDHPNEWTHFVYHDGHVVGTVTHTEGNPEPRRTQIFSDFLGSPAVTVTGNKVTSYLYGPYGVQLTAPRHEGAGGYTGHEDDATGLTYMRARYMDGLAARFLTPDPARDLRINLSATFNLYQYAGGNPINAIDPFGLAQTGREWAERLAGDAFRDHNEFKAYAYLGLSGFLGTADGISRVANNWVFGQEDELTGWDYANAVLDVGSNFPVGKALRWGKGLLVVDELADAGSLARSVNRSTAGSAGLNIISSALEESSKAAFKAADDIAAWVPKNKHLLSGGSQSKAKFLTDNIDEIRDLVQEALRSPDALFLANEGLSDSLRIVVNLGKAVGVKGQQALRIIVKDNKVVNAFPVHVR